MPPAPRGPICVPAASVIASISDAGEGRLGSDEAPRFGLAVDPLDGLEAHELGHCRELARALVAALRDLKVAKPEDVAGLL